MKYILFLMSTILFSSNLSAAPRSKGAAKIIQVNLDAEQEKEKDVLFQKGKEHIDVVSVENINAISCYLFQDGKELGGYENVSKCQFNIDKTNIDIKYTVFVKNENKNKQIEVEIIVY